ncbi:hypothetical protein PV327_008808 [Microctonus hyperodae]|uniref:Exonuclease domain-containing protein n=1 Tax=Microctonus hyperodae TaxID=165561 RepID=A0AA39FSS8_MICHY|nr:hypothetical protein PV327_008808 [Microctonus hyperodae]
MEQNNGNSEELAAAIRSIPQHIFDQHENCGTWCSRKQNSDNQTVKLQDLTLFVKLETLFNKYANNASKFSTSASSQANENFNNIAANKAPKSRCLSRSSAADFRIADAVCTKNVGESSILNIQQKLNITPGSYTSKYVMQYDGKKAKRSDKIKTKAYKKRRIELSKNREKLRQRNEKTEGVMYKSNCGINSQEINLFSETSNYSQMRSLPDSTVIVYFDLETCGLYRSDCILQIAAVCDNFEFNVYITPTQKISSESTEITGLHSIGDELFLRNTKIISLSLKDALLAFLQFLKTRQRLHMRLVAHNAKFDVSRLLKAIISCEMEKDFSVITSFCDTLGIFRKTFSQRKGPGMFKLSTLASDILKINDSHNFHEALYDVKILKKLVMITQNENEIVNQSKKYSDCLTDESQYDIIHSKLKNLVLLKNVVSEPLLKKMALENISYDILQDSLENGGEVAVIELLSEKCVITGKPKVTSYKKAISKIIQNLKENE